MISTEPALAAARLPPVPGLLDDLLLSVVRARQRRVATLDNPGQTLNALRVADATIDRALVAASLYGPSASQLLDQWLQDTDTLPSAGERSALVFVRVALALQLCLQATRAGAAASPADDDWLLQTERFATDEPRAVHDALRFAPVPALQLQDHAGHVSALLDRSRRKPALLALAIQLAGEREVTSLKATLETLAASRTVGAMVHHTLASMGEARHDTRARVNEGLRSRQPDAVAAAVRTACVDPRLADDDALIAALPWGPAVAADAWAVLICRHPRRTHDHALSQTDADAMDVATKLRISALAGYMDSTLMVCATLAERDSPITPAEADVLRLVLGEVPVETASRPPGPQQARSQALRQLVLKVRSKSGRKPA